jgi:transposase
MELNCCLCEVNRAMQRSTARLVLLIADGERYGAIRNKLDYDINFIARWKSRFIAEGLAGLYSRHVGRAAHKLNERLKAVFLNGRHRESPQMAQLTGRVAVAMELGDVSHMTIARVWANTP